MRRDVKVDIHHCQAARMEKLCMKEWKTSGILFFERRLLLKMTMFAVSTNE